tara:strand:- start:12960 stop:14537 length:1578 start_codon:yes stop_codon:yes gene_type:complete
MKLIINKQIKKLIIFFPILIYLGKRSYLAYDSGFYALQARWILADKNWIIPKWWNEYLLDRTIGIQYLIAKSQSIFGENQFAAHIPTTLAAFLMIFLTYKLHEKLVDKKGAIYSCLLLSTTFIWFDFAHQATQDMIFACLVTTGLYALNKIERNKKIIFHILFGGWIGLAFMMKTFLIAVPLIGLIPAIFEKKKIINYGYFFIGLLIGFSPFIIWSLRINQFLDNNIIIYLLSKFSSLSSQNTFTNPFYYYLWNIPINFLPWSIFSFIGILLNYKFNQKNKFLLCYFPIIFVLLISIFSTKTPYYALPIASILSINSYTGIISVINSKKLKPIFLFFISKLIPIFLVSFIFIYFLLNLSINLALKEEVLLSFGLLLFALSWMLINKVNDPKKILILLILGPYLFTSLIIQSGLFTDRSKNIRESMEKVIALENLNNKIVNINTSDIIDNNSHSKIIRIALLTPNLGSGIENFNKFETFELLWTTKSTLEKLDEKLFKVIYQDKYLNPWILVRKINYDSNVSDKIN